jgi:hypothetical protein
MRDLAESQQPIDISTVADELARHDELEMVGGAAHLSDLIDGAVPENLSRYLNIVREFATRRRAVKASEELQQLAANGTASATALADVARHVADEISTNDALPPRFSEEALALRFSRQHADHLRFVSAWGQWMLWDGKQWTRDNTLLSEEALSLRFSRQLIDDRCWTAVGALFADWQRWCEQAGEREGSQKRFSQQLEARGFRRERTNRAKGFHGIGLREDVPDVPGSPISTVTRAQARTPITGESGTSGTHSANHNSGHLQAGP